MVTGPLPMRLAPAKLTVPLPIDSPPYPTTLATDTDPAVIDADVFRTLGTSDRTIRLWANPVGATLVAGGYAIIEALRARSGGTTTSRPLRR